MSQQQKMPGAVGSQSRAQIEGMGEMSPTPRLHYTSFPKDVNSRSSLLDGHALDWAERSLRDADLAATLGNEVAELDLVRMALQAVSLIQCDTEEETWTL